jgi:hypothetical protein
MASGFTSKYNDAGYTLPTTPTTPTWYDESNNPVVAKVPSKDIYTTTSQTGVYMFNGTSTGAFIYPIICSLKNMGCGGGAGYADDGWIVYPGWGFILYSAINYGTQRSRAYTNTSSKPVFYNFNTGITTGTPIYESDNNATASNGTASVEIFFRGFEQAIPGLSYTKPANPT